MRSWRTSILQFLLALVLSLALWTYVSFSLNPSRQDSVEVAITLAPPANNLLVVDPVTGKPITLQPTAQVQFTGPEADLSRWQPENFRATADLSALPAGTYDVPIAVDGPSNARIRSITPPTISVQLEPQVRRSFTVEPRSQGSVPFLFEAADPTFSVQTANVIGPERLVARVARVVVDVDLRGRTESINETRALVAVDQTGVTVDGVTVTPGNANVAVTVTPRVERQRVPVAPQTTGQLPTGYRFNLDWNPKSVEVIATIPITGTLYTERIDLTGKTDTFTQTVQLEGIDQSINVLTDEPITVEVTITPVTQPYNLSFFVPITVVNEAPSVDAVATPPGLTVTVNGTTSQFQQLATTTVQGTVDVSNLAPGTYQRPVTINLPVGLQIVGDPPVVSVTVTAASPPPQPSEGG